MTEIRDWFAEQASGLFASAPDVTVDAQEITVVGERAADEGSSEQGPTTAHLIAEFRERTRAERIAVARKAEALFGRKVSWGVRDGESVVLFTHLSVPVMTRLRQPERVVLDTLVAAGVARSRSDALAWCVRLVGEHEGEWITRLREALRAVDDARAAGPHQH